MAILSQETVKDWSEGGHFQTADDIYKSKRFSENEDQRMIVKINKRRKIVDLLSLIRMKTNYPLHELLIYRVKYSRKMQVYEFTQIEKENWD